MEAVSLKDQAALESDEQNEEYCMEKPIGSIEIPVFRLGSTKQELSRRRHWIQRRREFRKEKQAQS